MASVRLARALNLTEAKKEEVMNRSIFYVIGVVVVVGAVLAFIF